MLKCIIPCEFFEINTSDFQMVDDLTIEKIKIYNEEMNQMVNLDNIFENIIYLKNWQDFRTNLFIEQELSKIGKDNASKFRDDPANEFKYLNRQANLSTLLKYFFNKEKFLLSATHGRILFISKIQTR